MLRTTSVLSNRTVKKGSREALVLEVHEAKGVPLTDREVMEALEMHDPNMVRPQITRLLIKMILKETGTRYCDATQKLVRTTMIDTLQHPGSGGGPSLPPTERPEPGDSQNNQSSQTRSYPVQPTAERGSRKKRWPTFPNDVSAADQKEMFKRFADPKLGESYE